MELLGQYIRCRIGTIEDLSDYISAIANQAFVNEYQGEATDLMTCYRLEDTIRKELEIRLIPFMARGILAEVECMLDPKNTGSVITSWYLTNPRGEVVDANDAIRRMNHGSNY